MLRLRRELQFIFQQKLMYAVTSVLLMCFLMALSFCLHLTHKFVWLIYRKDMCMCLRLV